MSDAPRIVYTPRSDANAKTEAAVLATVYSFVLQAHQDEKKAAGTSGGEEHARKESKDVSRNRTIPRH